MDIIHSNQIKFNLFISLYLLLFQNELKKRWNYITKTESYIKTKYTLHLSWTMYIYIECWIKSILLVDGPVLFCMFFATKTKIDAINAVLSVNQPWRLNESDIINMRIPVTYLLKLVKKIFIMKLLAIDSNGWCWLRLYPDWMTVVVKRFWCCVNWSRNRSIDHWFTNCITNNQKNNKKKHKLTNM